jgi:hypothetical protein
MKRSDLQQAAFEPGVTLEPGHPEPCGGAPLPLPLPREADETDYGRRTFLNLLATICLLVVATGIIWAVQALDAQEKLRRCLDTGARECVQLVPPRPGIRVMPNH